MSKKITLLTSLFIIIIAINSIVIAENIKIIPLKKPILSKEIKDEKLSQNIIKPLSKPKKKVKNEKITPSPKPKNNEINEEKITKKQKKIDFLIPKNKPIIVKKEIKKVEKKSKYFNKKDFLIAKKINSSC